MLNFNAPPIKNTAAEPVWKVDELFYSDTCKKRVKYSELNRFFANMHIYVAFLLIQVLIYDRFGQDIISPLLSVKELRDMGITLHL